MFDNFNDKENNYKFTIDNKENDDCEACADHVCNDECGCPLSKKALENLKDKK